MSLPARLLLVTSNGAGMGHLTRLLSVALAAGDGATSTIMSLSVAMPVVTAHGVAGEYCPSSERRWMPEAMWHGYLRDRLVALAHEVDADVMAFDGVAPYPGIVQARPLLRDVAYAWIRRGMWQPGVNAVQLAKSGIFDLVIEPGDIARDADRGPTAERSDAIVVPPITMLDAVERLPRAEAAAHLGIDPDRPTVLVTLGSGRVGEVEAPGTVVVAALLEDRDWQLCVTRAAIANKAVPLVDRDRVVELHGVYPLARYLAAFDAAVSAAGYNAVHELLPAGVPTLLLPNPATRTDDQVARALWLDDQRLALAALPHASADLVAAARRLSDVGLREDLSAACASLPATARSGGSSATADLLVDMARGFVPAKVPFLERRRRFARAGRETAKELLGPRGTDAVRRLLGRQPVGGLPGRLEVELVTGSDRLASVVDGRTPLFMTDAVPDELIHSGPVVEHLLAGSSAGYRAERLRIATVYYDVAGSARLPGPLS